MTLAALAQRRQERVCGHADALADAAERLVARRWREILASLDCRHCADAYPRAHAAAAGLTRDLHTLLLGKFVDLARWAHRSAVWAVATRAPRPLLKRAAARRFFGDNHDGRAFASGAGTHPAAQRGAGSGAALQGLRATLPRLSGEPDTRAGRGHHAVPEAALPLRVPGCALLEAESDWLSVTLDWQSLLLPAPSDSLVASIVYGSGWRERLAASTRLAAPETVAGIVATGLAQGLGQADIARRLLPVVDGVRSTARRLARTEAMRVAATMQLAAHEALGPDVVAGYTVRAVLDPHTRPEHRARDGTQYYRNPGPGQKGFDEMPRPPHESPRDGGGLAFNCRCWLEVILAGE